MIKSKSTKNVPYPFFLLGLVGCEGMWHYGTIINNGTLILLNSFGTILQIVYILAYISVCKSKTQPLLYLSIILSYLLGIYGYIYTVYDNDNQRGAVLGASSSIVTTIMMVLPVFEIVDNFKNKNANGMPPVMLIFGNICAISWLWYGILLGDINIYGPNIPGILLNTIKLYAIFLYGGKKEKDL
ncbi:DgyrCDS7138 [Dimorphilus gyrociliatus]|uniref:Sugar transporter SWEET1 n=1 Tax=Dimorphilus gyrociliatus TaxID=2664684 RepID=A0A7I8VSE7_9ANNE|nr:DgyrCDS7138 [Dimorphilus gyrociliatus]